jgi:hypothetical protein
MTAPADHPRFTGSFWTRQVYFGWLDDIGDVVRWSTDRPPAGQGYIRRDPVPIDIDNFGEALL